MYVCSCPFLPQSRVCLAFFFLLCLTRVVRTPFSQFARLVRSSSSISSKSTRTAATVVSFIPPKRNVLVSRCHPLTPTCPASHRAHTVRARCPRTMRTSPTLGCLFTPSTSTPTTCLPTTLTLPRILSPVAPRSVTPTPLPQLADPPFLSKVLWLPFTLLLTLTIPLKERHSSLRLGL